MEGARSDRTEMLRIGTGAPWEVPEELRTLTTAPHKALLMFSAGAPPPSPQPPPTVFGRGSSLLPRVEETPEEENEEEEKEDEERKLEDTSLGNDDLTQYHCDAVEVVTVQRTFIHCGVLGSFLESRTSYTA